jgi:hypothetical protein
MHQAILQAQNVNAREVSRCVVSVEYRTFDQDQDVLGHRALSRDSMGLGD